MPFTAIAGVCKAEVLFHNEGFNGVNVLWVGGFDTTDSDQIAQVASFMASRYQENILPQKTGAFVLDAIRLTSWDTATGPQSTSVSNEAGGRAAATPMAPERSCIIQLRTALRGRSHRGRIYDAGYADDQADGRGRLSAASMTQVAQLWLDFRSDMAVDVPGWSLMVVSHTLGLANPVNDLSVADVVGIQRRRIRD